MNKSKKKSLVLLFILTFVCFYTTLYSQTTNQQNTNGVTTYLNPMQPGDHPDQTLMRVGKDFYSTGSTFHLGAYVPIYHSTDLVHWEIIARIVPMGTSGVSDGPGAGVWQGALAQFGGYFWVYYSINSAQHFSKASAMTGPWSAPTKVTGSTVTGYDNSIFVDDDGTPYMLMKNGQYINRIQQIDKNTGQLTGTLMNCDWINASKQYSWAEGPTMCKRNGRYYYFVAGNVGGGQYVLSTSKLTADSSFWVRHGNFFTAATNPSGLSSPNHVSQPVQLDDGTWWCISHAYDNSGWQAQGRLCNLHQINWDASGVPHAVNPSNNPVAAPNLPNTKNIALNLPREDYFSATTLDLDWHFFNKTTATKYSLSANPGNLRLNPGTGTTHVLQKEGGHFYTMVTKVTINATATGQQAGLRITNGGDAAYYILYAGYNGTKKIGFGSNSSVTEVNNTIGNTVWLKIDRENHSLKGYYSADGKTWTQIGGTIDATAFDKDQGTDYNKWVGTSIGLYAKDISADFDLFKYRDGLSALKVYGSNNKHGVTTSTKTPGTVVSNNTTGDWLMLAGVSMSDGTTGSSNIEVNAASASGTGSLEIWIDNIGGLGTKLATIPITASGGADVWKNYSANVSVTGQHDLYLKFIGSAGSFSVNTVRFGINLLPPTVTSPVVYCQNATSVALTATGTALKWYNVPTGGTALTAAPTPSTANVGLTTYYVSQTVGGVESARSNIIVTVNAIPTIPAVNSSVKYSEGATATALTATGTALKWYNVPTGGIALPSAPTPSTTTTGTSNYYVTQTVNTCESSRATIAVVIASDNKIILKAGWNYIGCPIVGSTALESALSSIWSNVLIIKNLDVFYASANAATLNSLSTVEWGQGYFVNVKTACELNWTIK